MQKLILVNAVKAFARSTYQCVYIIDFFKRSFIYVSDNLAWLCGQPLSKIGGSGYEFYVQHVPPVELPMLNEIYNSGFSMFNRLPYAERMEYTIMCDFHLANGKEKRLIHHKLTPLMLNEEGRLRFALCTMSASASDSPGNVIMGKENGSTYFEYCHKRRAWIEKERMVLSKMEKDVLRLSAQGHTMKQIADRLCKSIDTVKACKKTLFAKLGVKNISGALSYAMNYKKL